MQVARFLFPQKLWYLVLCDLSCLWTTIACLAETCENSGCLCECRNGKSLQNAKKRPSLAVQEQTTQMVLGAKQWVISQFICCTKYFLENLLSKQVYNRKVFFFLRCLRWKWLGSLCKCYVRKSVHSFHPFEVILWTLIMLRLTAFQIVEVCLRRTVEHCVRMLCEPDQPVLMFLVRK